jgi:hypothetical protein
LRKTAPRRHAERRIKTAPVKTKTPE